MSDVIEDLRERRKALGLSQDDLVAASGVSRATLTKMENGHGPFSELSVARVELALEQAARTRDAVRQSGDLSEQILSAVTRLTAEVEQLRAEVGELRRRGR